MSDITMNNEESQNKNQKTTPVTESHFELNDPRISLFGLISKIWLGIKNDYRTLIGVDSLDIIEKEEDDDSEENGDV